MEEIKDAVEEKVDAVLESKKEEIKDKVEDALEKVDEVADKVCEKVEEVGKKALDKLDDVVPGASKVVEALDEALVGSVISCGCFGWRFSAEKLRRSPATPPPQDSSK